MQKQIRQKLFALRWRQRTITSLDWMVFGAVCGALGGILLEVVRLNEPTWLPDWMNAWWIFGTVVLLAIATAAVGACWPIPVGRTMRLIDRHYGLKDTMVSAWCFAGRTVDDPMLRLQVADAVDRLSRISASQLLPILLPRRFPLLALLATILFTVPFLPRREQSNSPVDLQLMQVVQNQALEIRADMLNDLQKIAEQTAEQNLKELIEEVSELTNEMQSEQTDKREALSKLSQMQQSMAEMLNKYNAEKTEAELKQLAAALESAKPLQKASEALKESDFQKASEELKQVDPDQLQKNERQAVAENLQRLQKELSNPESTLAESARKMQEGLERSDKSQFKEGAEQAADIAKQQSIKNSIRKALNAQLNRLNEYKGEYQAIHGGEKTGKTNKDSDRWGRGESNKPLGENATQLDSQRQKQEVTGVQGDGESIRQESDKPTGEDVAGRSYQSRYTEFRRQMEAVLESEPLPLGHRETVRKYFELIRPASEKTTEN